MVFNLDKDFYIFDNILSKRPEISESNFKKDLQRYYLPYIEKLVNLKKRKSDNKGLVIGVSAIQGTGKTTQGEILEALFQHFGYTSLSLSIDDHYLPHQELEELRKADPRFIRRGVTHDINLAIKNLSDLKDMSIGDEVKIPIYDKGAFSGDGDRTGWKTISQKPDFIFYDGWMLGAKHIEDDSVFDQNLPALETPESKQFAKDINKKLIEYQPLWDVFDFLNVLFVPNYQISITWRDQAEDVLRQKGTGMTHEQIKEFVYYFWRSIHPAIYIKNLSQDPSTDQVVIINDDHTIKEVLSPEQVKSKYS